MTVAVVHPLTETELACLCKVIHNLHLPVTVDMDGDTAVLHVQDACTSRAEMMAMRIVESHTDSFRCVRDAR